MPGELITYDSIYKTYLQYQFTILKHITDQYSNTNFADLIHTIHLLWHEIRALKFNIISDPSLSYHGRQICLEEIDNFYYKLKNVIAQMLGSTENSMPELSLDNIHNTYDLEGNELTQDYIKQNCIIFNNYAFNIGSLENISKISELPADLCHLYVAFIKWSVEKTTFFLNPWTQSPLSQEEIVIFLKFLNRLSPKIFILLEAFIQKHHIELFYFFTQMSPFNNTYNIGFKTLETLKMLYPIRGVLSQEEFAQIQAEIISYLEEDERARTLEQTRERQKLYADLITEEIIWLAPSLKLLHSLLRVIQYQTLIVEKLILSSQSFCTKLTISFKSNANANEVTNISYSMFLQPFNPQDTTNLLSNTINFTLVRKGHSPILYLKLDIEPSIHNQYSQIYVKLPILSHPDSNVVLQEHLSILCPHIQLLTQSIKIGETCMILPQHNIGILLDNFFPLSPIDKNKALDKLMLTLTMVLMKLRKLGKLLHLQDEIIRQILFQEGRNINLPARYLIKIITSKESNIINIYTQPLQNSNVINLTLINSKKESRSFMFPIIVSGTTAAKIPLSISINFENSTLLPLIEDNIDLPLKDKFLLGMWLTIFIKDIKYATPSSTNVPCVEQVVKLLPKEEQLGNRHRLNSLVVAITPTLKILRALAKTLRMQQQLMFLPLDHLMNSFSSTSIVYRCMVKIKFKDNLHPLYPSGGYISKQNRKTTMSIDYYDPSPSNLEPLIKFLAKSRKLLYEFPTTTPITPKSDIHIEAELPLSEDSPIDNLQACLDILRIEVASYITDLYSAPNVPALAAVQRAEAMNSEDILDHNL